MTGRVADRPRKRTERGRGNDGPPAGGRAATPLAGVPFLKVDGAGNDFVLLDARRGVPPRLSRAAVRELLDRHRGIGGDGLLVVENGPTPGDLRVRFRNPDGGPASFCGNGARCVALVLLRESRAAGVTFRLGRVRVEARRARGGRVSVLVPEPRPLPVPAGRPPAGPDVRDAWYHSGVPHWIVPVPSVDAVDLAALARPLRAWKALGPGGTNVDVVEIRGRVLRVRTWERGVEGETLACGSGLVASGYWASSRRGLGLPLDLRTAGGDRLRLEADPAGRGLWLEGPARVVFRGTLAAVPSQE
jgi:diaminopimelate epimerase